MLCSSVVLNKPEADVIGTSTRLGGVSTSGHMQRSAHVCIASRPCTKTLHGMQAASDDCGVWSNRLQGNINGSDAAFMFLKKSCSGAAGRGVPRRSPRVLHLLRHTLKRIDAAMSKNKKPKAMSNEEVWFWWSTRKPDQLGHGSSAAFN